MTRLVVVVAEPQECLPLALCWARTHTQPSHGSAELLVVLGRVRTQTHRQTMAARCGGALMGHAGPGCPEQEATHAVIGGGHRPEGALS